MEDRPLLRAEPPSPSRRFKLLFVVVAVLLSVAVVTDIVLAIILAERVNAPSDNPDTPPPPTPPNVRRNSPFSFVRYLPFAKLFFRTFLSAA